jgi:hypothetical protein
MFRTSLRDHDHGNARVPERAKETTGYAGDAYHAGTLDIDNRHAVNRSESFHCAAGAAVVINFRSRRRRIEGVPDLNRDLLFDGRSHRTWMNDLGTKIS